MIFVRNSTFFAFSSGGKKTVCTIPFIYICTSGNDMIHRAIGDPITANEAKAHTPKCGT
jgi:hypothetical protein